MFWQEWSGRLKEGLKLDRDPVAVTFAGEEAPAPSPSQERVSVCQALKRAGQGEAFVITKETCGCPGGLVSLGLGQQPPEGKERTVRFLVDREKVYCSRAAIHRGQQTVEPPLGMASRVCFAPLAESALQPDLVVFIGKPGSLHALISLASYWEGGSLKAELAGPACRTGVAYPVVTGEIGLSLLDSGARRLGGFEEDQLLVSVPLHRMIGLMHALDQTGQGGRDLENLEREIEELGPVE